ncbi:kelch domain-containing protein 4, partial [Lasius niger]
MDRGCVHADMFLLTQTDKNDVTKYKWAFMFGGVYDNDDHDNDEENLCGTFYNDLLALDLEKLHWRAVTLTEKKATTVTDDSKGRRRRKKKEEADKEVGQSNISDEEVSEESSNLEGPTVSVDDDGIFT